jgi:ferredoxin
MRVRVDPVKCQGYAVCGEVAPRHFSFDDWGFAQAMPVDIDDESLLAVEEAIQVCPVRAIRRISES